MPPKLQTHKVFAVRVMFLIITFTFTALVLLASYELGRHAGVESVPICPFHAIEGNYDT